MKPNTMNLIIGSTKHARDKHPDFADNICRALCLAKEEMGEVAKAINDRADWEEVVSEIYDTIAVLVRILREDSMKNSAFACCSHCGDQFFKTDLIKTTRGRLCPCCKEKGGF